MSHRVDGELLDLEPLSAVLVSADGVRPVRRQEVAAPRERTFSRRSHGAGPARTRAPG